MFNTLDKWMEYDKLEIADYTLYGVSYTKANMTLKNM